MTYEQRLREMIHLLEAVEGDDPMVVLCQQARIALSFGAECYKDGFNIGWSKRDNQQELTEYGIEQHLISLGLIEPQTEKI